jgi:hypothetical protein
MKKFPIFIICAALLFLAACGGGSSGSTEKKGDTMTLQEIFDAIHTDVEDLPMAQIIVPDAESYLYYAFIDPIEGAETLVSESAINAVPHTAVLIRVPEGTDVEKVAAELTEKADPRKWICVEAEKTIVRTHGRTLLLVMSFSETADALTTNFDKLWA